MGRRRGKSKLKIAALLVLHVLVLWGLLVISASPGLWVIILLIFIEGIYLGRLSTRPPLLRDPAYDDREAA
ncbi:hypothetical protein ASESINO_209 [Erwinia phage vB_EamM_Asesino]|uniref:Uncharacterized protein n=1 Tax=Erwinia phage vB_EamM_Asesino TaxID=1883370 RepID=A0A1B2IAE5_9CAUD|nr:hypothetical protein ASESINO_209 [Erwinia phage vB_EamM_Asesino]ANZ48222.1 hypothetical protein ASESINO_209 [Erwinia phage vB_EamM_Asesino]